MRDVPLRRSLLLRLLAVSAVVSLFSIAATAWLAARTVTVAARQDQGRTLADDAAIYDALVGYAATHRDWSRASHLVRELARSTGHRITLTTQDGDPLVDSATPASGRSATLPPSAEPSAVVDPLAVDATLLPGTGSDRIDPRAVGPFRLPARERAALRTAADERAHCFRVRAGVRAEVVAGADGRPGVSLPDGPGDALPESACRQAGTLLDEPTATESRALDQLSSLVNGCLARRDVPPVRLDLGHDWSWLSERATLSGDDNPVTSCLRSSRREQLEPHVSSAALLFVRDPDGAPTTGFDLSRDSQARIAATGVVVLLITVTVTLLMGTRLVRPLRALTGVARRMKDGDTSARATITGRDEISRLAVAFNELSEHRERLERLRKAMVNDVAHELRTPLSNIRGWLEAASDGVVSPDRELTSSLLEEALLLQRVIDDLQDLAAADAGELELRRVPVSVDELLNQVATAHRHQADAAGIALVVASGSQPPVTADPARLRQMVGNLVSNAVRHTPPGGTVALRSRPDGDHALIEVADTGSGISPDELPLVFERFWRAEKSRNRRTGGSGLGLSIVRKLAESHGGTVDATSTPGEGSVFTLRLPVHPEEPAGAVPTDAKDRSGGTTS